MRKVEFNIAFDRIFDHEGGFQKQRADRGNWTSGVIGLGDLKGTKFGISAMSYPELDIRNITKDQAKDIYYRDFWTPLKGDQMPSEIVYQLFDASLHHGLVSALKMLQRAINVKDDGFFGPISANALTSISIHDLLMLFLAERLEFMTDVRNWKEYSRGWSRRIAQNLRYAAKDTLE